MLKGKLLFFLEKKIGLVLSSKKDSFLLGRSYKVFPGTIRQKPDYDDAWLLALAQRAERVFDIGCNIGQASLLMLYPGSVQEILLVDPNPTSLAIAAENLIQNHLSDFARFICAFVNDGLETSVKFYTVLRGAAGSMYASHAKSAANMCSSFIVPTVTIDQLVKKYGFRPDLVKIDVEGAEVQVLNGATGLSRYKETMFIVEMHSNSELSMADNSRAVLGWCCSMNYHAWYLKEKFLLIEPDQIAHRGRCHLLLLPENEPLPDVLINIEQGAALEKVPFISDSNR